MSTIKNRIEKLEKTTIKEKPYTTGRVIVGIGENQDEVIQKWMDENNNEKPDLMIIRKIIPEPKLPPGTVGLKKSK